MNIKFTDHCLDKIEILKKHGIDISKEQICKVVSEPDFIEMGYKNRKIAQSKLDENHVLRVVYEKNNDDILIVTIYPGRSSRYDKS